MSNSESNKDLTRIVKAEGALSLFTSALSNADAILTGVAGTQKLNLFMIPGRLVQAARNKDFVSQLAQELEELRKKGHVKEDYAKSEQATSCLQELLAALENPPVDGAKFEALKNIFLNAAREKITSRDDATPQLLMSIAKDLSSAEILLLSAIYRIGKGKVATEYESNAQRQLQYLAQNSHLKTTGLVELTESKLIEKKLIADRDHADRSGIKRGFHFRLTDFGFNLCKFFVEVE